MLSYRSEAGRPRPRNRMSQNRNASSPSVTGPSKVSPMAPDSESSEPQTKARQMAQSSRTSRSLSVSVAEEAHPVAALSRPKPTKIPSSNDVRLSLLPRPTANQQSSHIPLNVDRAKQQQQQQQPQQFNMKLQKQMPAAKDGSSLRNPLRRKAATIGQTFKKATEKADAEKPEKLRVVIPNTPRPGHFTDANPRVPSVQTEMVTNEPATSNTPDQTGTMDNTEPPAIQGPKELASLRTIVNTQNLPPPTPMFASASSPSTRYSESPGIWSWSRGSTPTSVSSHSPGIIYPPKVGHRLKQASPSDIRLTGLSPLMQPGTPHSGVDQMSTKSPNSQKDVGSSISPVAANQQDLPKDSEATKSPVQSKSALPRRTSFKSTTLPPRTKTDNQAKREDEAKKCTEGPTGTVHKTKTSGSTPFRPSRDGTDELDLEPSPIIQSDLPPKTVSSHKRRDSLENNSADKQPTPSPSSTTPIESVHSRKPSRGTLPTTSPVTTTQKNPRIPTKGKQEKPDTKSPSTPSSATSKRFGLFSRKNKSENDANSGEKSRKGPTAGTGHEGYGKYAQRGRKSSASSNSGGSRTGSTSTASSAPKSTPSSGKGAAKGRQELGIDDFFLNRLEPVVISGGGKDDATLARTSTEQSMSGGSTVSAKGAHSNAGSTDSLASSTGTAGEPRVYPGIPPKHPGRDTSKSKQEKPSKKGKGIRSFFQRSNSKQPKNAPPEASTLAATQLHAKVTPVLANRPVAHYAILDNDPGSLEDIIQNVEDSPPTEYEDEPEMPVEVPAALNVQKNRQSALLPPKLQTEFPGAGNYPPRVYMNKNPNSAGTENEECPQRRPSRLASIGRIPQVVSRRDRRHKPASQSFSRPFSLSESPSLMALAEDRPNEPQASASYAPAAEMGKSLNGSAKPSFDLTQPFGDPMQKGTLDFVAGPYSKNEFLRFSPDKNKPLSPSNNPEGAAVAAITSPGDLNEDDIWGEYDDLIDHVLSPITPEGMLPCPGPSEMGENFELAARASKALQSELDAHHGTSDLLPTPAEHGSVGVNRSASRTSDDSVHLRRSRIVSALRSSFAPSPQPSYSDLNAAKLDNESKETEAKELDTNKSNSDRPSTPPAQPKEQPIFFPSPLNSSESFEVCRQRNTVLFDIAERDREGPTSQTNIRSGSLMTSRWLSFGRVLFSPAHNHVQTGEQERILVIDGLGNDDWSFYCALTYTNAHVYNLHVGPSPASSPNPAAWQPPANYHTTYYPSLADRFPFPKGFFAATVLRFPAACSEYVQDNIVSECNRVLRPGGYMEMSILDLDMVNMGVNTRKAVRGLKERTYLADPSISLKPASDNIQRLLGRHSFDNLHRCMVRIPVAGVITRSSASSSSTASSSSLHPSMSIPAASRSAPSFGQGHNRRHRRTESSAATGATTYDRHEKITHRTSPSNETNLSLGDLLSDPAPSPSNDESIRKIVAKVGRWWYTRCYEIPVLPHGDVDLRIWSDKKVLRECQKRGTGFRLLIAHAQKPSEVNRRTASV